MKPALLAAAMVCACGMAASADPAEPPVPSEERIRELVKKLETPTRKQGDQKPGPPDYAWDKFNYRIQEDAIKELNLAGDAATSALLALLNDKTKPGQARSQTVAVLAYRLRGEKTKHDPKIVDSIIAALNENDPALRYGVLQHLSRFGLGDNRQIWNIYKNQPEFKHFPGPETRSFDEPLMDTFLPAIIATLKDEHAEVVKEAAITIWFFGRPKTGTEELLAVLNRKEPTVRGTVFGALARIGTHSEDALKAVLRELDRQELYQDSGALSAVVSAAGYFGSKSKDIVTKLVRIVNDKYLPSVSGDEGRSVRDEAVRALRRIGPDAKDSIPTLLACLDKKFYMIGDTKQEHYRGSRDEVLQALDKIDPKVAVKARAEEKRKQAEYHEWLRQNSERPLVPPEQP